MDWNGIFLVHPCSGSGDGRKKLVWDLCGALCKKIICRYERLKGWRGGTEAEVEALASCICKGVWKAALNANTRPWLIESEWVNKPSSYPLYFSLPSMSQRLSSNVTNRIWGLHLSRSDSKVFATLVVVWMDPPWHSIYSISCLRNWIRLDQTPTSPTDARQHAKCQSPESLRTSFHGKAKFIRGAKHCETTSILTCVVSCEILTNVWICF